MFADNPIYRNWLFQVSRSSQDVSRIVTAAPPGQKKARLLGPHILPFGQTAEGASEPVRKGGEHLLASSIFFAPFVLEPLRVLDHKGRQIGLVADRRGPAADSQPIDYRLDIAEI